eukprot:Hpha_TRINITY_DN16811_c3_g2::TRINITY_DN16811_c3_g2_i3::g.151293::m.151293
MASRDNLVETIITMLEQFVASSGRCQVAMGTPFDSKDPPPITLRAYVARLEKYLHCSTECYLYSLILIDRLIAHSRNQFKITSFNVHRVLLSALIVAAKMRDDVYYANKYYAQVGGVDIKELNFLESYFLTLLDWDIHVSAENYCRYLDELSMRYGDITGCSGELLEKWRKTEPAREYRAEQRRNVGGGVSSGESSSESQVGEEEEAEVQPEEVAMRRCPFSMDSVNVSSIGHSGDSGDDAEMYDESGCSFGSYYQQSYNTPPYNAQVQGYYSNDSPYRYDQQGWSYSYGHQAYGY